MEFVALLSGGKDSVYNIVKCVEEGHVLRCLANLSPFPSQVYRPSASPSTATISALGLEEAINEELHSFMYQSAGASVMPAYADCLQVPLFVEHIQGSATKQALDYEVTSEPNPTTAKDEVEDLFTLLQRVKQEYPEVKGVSCGAIVSTYQRLRVEHVCERLGLTLLAYLWQRDRVQLLPEMLDAGIDAVLVKVAGVGLVPEKHLQKSLKSLYPQLLQLHRKFGLDLCGEGGEYESLVLNAPFFHYRIVIQESQVLLDEEDCEVGNLKVARYQLLPNEHFRAVERRNTLTVDLAADLALLMEGENVDVVTDESVEEGQGVSVHSVQSATPSSVLRLHKDGYGSTSLLTPRNTLKFANMSVPTKEEMQCQVRDVMKQLKDVLAAANVSVDDAVFVHLYIADMEWFATVNEEYCRWFGKHPPSRSCVMLPLEDGVGVALSAFYLQGSYQAMLAGSVSGRPDELREVLHVKSMSHWAPLCIGPYAQCNTVYHRVLSHVAGQIPLNPGSMTLREHSNHSNAASDVKLDLVLALRHAARVLNVQQSSLAHVTQMLVYINTNHPLHRDASTRHWSTYKRLVQRAINHDYQLEVQYEPQGSSSNAQNDLFADDFLAEEQESWSEDGDLDHTDAGKSASSSDVLNSIVQFVGVPGLPRNSSLEVETVAVRSQVLLPATAWQHLHVSTRDCSADRILHLVHQAEMWPSISRKVTSQFLPVSLSDALYCEGFIKGFPGCVGSAVLEVCAKPALGGKYLSTELAREIARGFMLVCSQASLGLTTSTIRKMTLYFSVQKLSTADCQELTQAMVADFALLGFALDGSACALVILPATKLGDNVVATMSINSIDFHQIESEAWIERGKGFTS